MSRWFKITLIAFVFLSLLGGTFVLGFYLGGQKQPAIEKITSIINKEKKEVVAATDFEPFWKVWQILDKKHPKAALVDDEERVFGAIQGLAGSLKDPYTVFFPPDESKAF